MNLWKNLKISIEEFPIFLLGKAQPFMRSNHPWPRVLHRHQIWENIQRNLGPRRLEQLHNISVCFPALLSSGDRGKPGPSKLQLLHASITSLHQQPTSWKQWALLAVYKFCKHWEPVCQKLTLAQVEGGNHWQKIIIIKSKTQTTM